MNLLSIGANTVSTLQQLAQCLVVQEFGGLQELSEGIDELTLYLGRTGGAHLLQEFARSLDFTMGRLNRRSVIEGKRRALFDVLCICEREREKMLTDELINISYGGHTLIQELSRAVVLFPLEDQARCSGSNSSSVLF